VIDCSWVVCEERRARMRGCGVPGDDTGFCFGC